MISKSCFECDKKLTRDEIAISKKLISRATREFYCISCLAQHFGCTEYDIEVKIQEFKDQGCGLFV